MEEYRTNEDINNHRKATLISYKYKEANKNTTYKKSYYDKEKRCTIIPKDTIDKNAYEFYNTLNKKKEDVVNNEVITRAKKAELKALNKEAFMLYKSGESISQLSEMYNRTPYIIKKRINDYCADNNLEKIKFYSKTKRTRKKIEPTKRSIIKNNNNA